MFLGFFFLSFFSKIFFFLQGEWDFKENEQKQRSKKTHFFESKLGPIMLRNMLGPSFDSTFLLIFEYFYLFEKCRNHYFIVFSAKNQYFKPTPKIEEHYLWTQLH